MTGFVIAQALVEHSVLASLAGTFTTLRYGIESWVGEGHAPHVLIGAAVLVALFFVLRR